jgi:FixJ family two-component response regulator
MAPRAPRVFVIDDDHSVRRGLSRLLAAAGFEVEAFESGPAFLQRRPPRGNHCLIVDVRMSGMSGPALRDALRAEGRDSPVIFVTAHEIDEIGDEMAGEPILSKPIEADVLLRAIDAAMSAYASRISRRERLAPR